MQCVILAGGKGTRLAPLTDNCPKIMVPVIGKPFIEWQLDLIEKQDIIHEVIYCIDHLGDQIEAWIKEHDHSYKGMHLTISRPQKYLTVSGQIRYALPLLMNEFFVMYGDSYLPDVNWRHVKSLAMTSIHNNIVITRWGNEDYGLYWCSKRVFENVAYQVPQRFHEIGSPEGLAELETYLKEEQATADGS